jgi:signal transduction histidine kinase
VYGNPPKLERMFANVVANAMFFGPEGDEVRISASPADGNVAVSVRDFGPGVPEGELEDIFRAFYRVDRSRSRASGGAGLGLALARETAIRHGGNIAAENASPGLRVTVTLPAEDDFDGDRDGHPRLS